jgi:hypothetical protein
MTRQAFGQETMSSTSVFEWHARQVKNKVKSMLIIFFDFKGIFHKELLLAGQRVKRSQYSDCLRAGRPRGRSSSPARVKNFNFSMSFRPALRSTHPPIQCVPEAIFPGVKRQGHETDHSPTSAEVERTWIYTSTPPYVFMT